MARNNEFYTVNLTTGALTLVGPVDGVVANTHFFRGIAAPVAPATAVVPEPGSLALAGIYSIRPVGYAWQRHRRKRTA